MTAHQFLSYVRSWGLAQTAARAVAKRGATTYVEIDPHAFPSELLGESQRNISQLMTDTIPELAARRPHTVVLVDEVESFAVRRSAASFGANPVDVHRATDALLAGIDAVATDLPQGAFPGDDEFRRRGGRGLPVQGGSRARRSRCLTRRRSLGSSGTACSSWQRCGRAPRLWHTTTGCTPSLPTPVRGSTADGCASSCCPRSHCDRRSPAIRAS